MKFKAEFVFETNNACSIYEAILPELETPVSDRSIIEMSNTDSYLILIIGTEDVVSMRSALNTWLRLIQVAHEVAQTTDNAVVLDMK